MSAETAPVLNAYLSDDARSVVVVRRGEDGRRVLSRERADYATWHRAADVPEDLRRRLSSSSHVARVEDRGEWLLVCWRDDFDRKRARRWLEDREVRSFEGDVDPVRFWLTETRAKIARPRTVYLDIETDSRVPFSRKEEMRVLAWAIRDEEGNHRRGVLEADGDAQERRLLAELWDALEPYDQVLAWFGGDPEDPDDGFDFPVIAARTAARGLRVDTRRWLWVDMLVLWRRMNQHAAESGAEKESMRLEDIAQAVLGEGKERVPTFVLERFGAERCKDGLGALAWDLWSEGGAFRELLVAYCEKDTALLPKLEKKKGYVTVFRTLADVCGVLGDTRGLNPTQQFDAFAFRFGRERNHRFATKRFSSEPHKKFDGAYVTAPKSVGSDEKGSEWTKAQAREWRAARGMRTGILRDVHVCDFASLYPSIILTWNLSEDARRGSIAEGQPIPEGICRSPYTDVATTTEFSGIVVAMLKELLRLRKYWSDLAATLPPGSPEWLDAMARSTAYKVIANSFYGVLGTPFSRHFHVDLAESTAQNGVWLIKLTISAAERRRMDAIYTDTDSIFTVGPSAEAFGRFVAWCNKELYPRAVAELGCRENAIKLAYEKSFARLVFTTAKRYAGRYSVYKGTAAKADSKPEIKGLEYKRGDCPLLARRLQGRVIDMLVGGVREKDASGAEHAVNPGLETPTEDVALYRALVEEVRSHVLAGNLAIEEVRQSKSLSKEIGGYATRECVSCGARAPVLGECKQCGTRQPRPTQRKMEEVLATASLPPHVQVARELRRRGKHVGERARIEYVVVDGEAAPMAVIPAEDYAGECDRYYLWESLVYPPTRRLLEAAFPEEGEAGVWKAYEDVRPARQRGRSQRACEEQLGFFTAAGERPKGEIPPELAVQAYSSKPLVLAVPEEIGEKGLARVRAVLAAHPGPRLVEIALHLATGHVAMLSMPHRVATGPSVAEAVARAISG